MSRHGILPINIKPVKLATNPATSDDDMEPPSKRNLAPIGSAALAIVGRLQFR